MAPATREIEIAEGYQGRYGGAIVDSVAILCRRCAEDLNEPELISVIHFPRRDQVKWMISSADAHDAERHNNEGQAIARVTIGSFH